MFTVKIEPTLRRAPSEEIGVLNTRTTYDINVYDGTGADGEEKLVFSHQGYENREFAKKLAIRLFAAPHVMAAYIGVAPVEGFIGEEVNLVLHNAEGFVEDLQVIRP